MLEYLKNTYDEINRQVTRYEDYIKENGLPLLDFKMYRTKSMQINVFKKFQLGIKRIVRIQRSKKTNDITGVLKAHRLKIYAEREKRHNRQASLLQHGITHDGNSVQNFFLISMDSKINDLMDIVREQSQEIKRLNTLIAKDMAKGSSKALNTIVLSKHEDSSSAKSDTVSDNDSDYMNEYEYNKFRRARIEINDLEQSKKSGTKRGLDINDITPNKTRNSKNLDRGGSYQKKSQTTNKINLVSCSENTWQILS